MSQKYEYYDTGEDGYSVFDSEVIWLGQSFTPSISHRITKVKLKLYKSSGSPGTIIVSIKATDGSGHPTGSDLCSGTTDGSTLPTTPGEMREITLGNGYLLNSGTKYAIVVRSNEVNVGNSAGWRRDATSATYSGGCLESSGDSGSSWNSIEDDDYIFEEYGDPASGALPIHFVT